MEKKYVAYYRVSTKRQGRSGLGLEAQREIVASFVSSKQNIVKEYKDIVSGKDLYNLPQLHRAKQLVKQNGYILIIAKTDRLRNTQQALNLVEELGTDNIIFCDVGPKADKFTLTIFFALAERERVTTAKRIKEALTIKKSQGYKLGTPENLSPEAQKKGALANRIKSLNNPSNKKATILASQLREKGFTLQEISDELNKNGFKTPKGFDWIPGSVSRILSRK